jgi:hypothetical protein
MRRRLATPLAAALALCPLGVARADAPPATTTTTAPAAPPKVKATAFALSHADVPEATMVQVMRVVENGLKKNARLEMKDLESRLADFAQEVPQDEIDAARTAQKAGEQALLELAIPDAVAKLEAAVAGFAKVLPYIKKQELADAMASLAVAQFEGGDKKAGKAQFVELLTWRPDYLYDVQRLPPQYVAQFEDAQHEVERARRAPIRITTEPAGAQAYLDGKYIGVTPCTAEAEPVGKHFVTFKKEGYRKAVAVVPPSRRDAHLQVTLERSEKYLLVEQARAKVEAALGSDPAKLDEPAVDDLRQVLFLDHAVFVRVTPEAGKLSVDAWLYDLRTHRRLSRVHHVVSSTAVEAELEPLASGLYLNVSYEPELQAPTEAPPPKRVVRTPFYKTWWFWTAAAAVVAGAVGAGVAVYETRPVSCPDGSACVRVIP